VQTLVGSLVPGAGLVSVRQTFDFGGQARGCACLGGTCHGAAVIGGCCLELEQRRERLELELRRVTATLRSDEALRVQAELRPADARPRLKGRWREWVERTKYPAPTPRLPAR
jgi:uncharacterized Zn finger protein